MPQPPSSTMLAICSLLNPEIDKKNCRYKQPELDSTPPTPAHTAHDSSTISTPRRDMTTSSTLSIKQPKLVRDTAKFFRAPPRAAVNFPPFECTEDGVFLDAKQHHELVIQHQRFQVFPSGNSAEGLISDYVRHIPYSSGKKSFLTKTGRDAFDVFQYTFIIPGDPSKRTHVVMWDYHIGLVRITPFFKACKYSKTTPAKAIASNFGLKDLSHSITGGALAAQGYWMPYACARAICLTFCYPIRWALTPVFGLSFVKECLQPDHHNFACFRIDPEVVRCATLEAEGWTSADSARVRTLSVDAGQCGMNYSAPFEQYQGPQLRPRPDRPTFMTRSPFASEHRSGEIERHKIVSQTVDSPPVSPRTHHAAMADRGWTSINSPSLSTLTACCKPGEPLISRTDPHPSTNFSWREAAANPRTNATEAKLRNLTMSGAMSGAMSVQSSSSPWSTPNGERHMMHKSATGSPADPSPPIPYSLSEYKQSQLTSESDEMDTDGARGSSPLASESDEADIDIPRWPTRKKRKICSSIDRGKGMLLAEPKCKGKGRLETRDSKITKSSKFTAEDARAAYWLLNLSARDQQLGTGRFDGVAVLKRKASGEFNF